MKVRHRLQLAMLVVLAACGAKSGAGAPSQRNLLSDQEMIKAGYPDVFTTVQTLRPHWLQRRGTTSLRSNETVKVYLDGSLLGGPDNLRQIMTRSIGTIRYLDGMEASQRWGFDHGAGAIVVSTRKI